ncbi:MAG TPA: hypothetical protein VF103_08715 [Polyangiaceae bacterium]
MRTESVLVALLLSGCFSDPAYIGAGPATEVGKSEGGSGSGETEGGNGARPDAGSNLPLENGRCVMHERVLDETTVFTWDAEARTLSTDTFEPTNTLELRYDESGRLFETWSDYLGFLRHIEYDARGNVTALTMTSYGEELTSSSWDQENIYHGAELTNSLRTYHDGSS